MTRKENLAYAICVSIFFSGLTILLSYEPKYIGLLLVIFSTTLGYILYSKNRIIEHEININIKNAALGAILIVIDISYNIIINDAFASFDYGMLSIGMLIILLNFNFLNFLKIEQSFVDFTSKFLFLVLMFYGLLFSVIPFLLKVEENPFFVTVTKLTITSSGYILNLIKPTLIVGGTDIHFDGFIVGVWIPCSGVESITVFVAAIFAYFLSIKEKKITKIFTLATVGVVALFIMNILRIIIIILVGYHCGIDTMLFVHYNLGWIMFVLGMAVFWFLVFDSKKEGTERVSP